MPEHFELSPSINCIEHRLNNGQTQELEFGEFGEIISIYGKKMKSSEYDSFLQLEQ